MIESGESSRKEIHARLPRIFRSIENGNYRLYFFGQTVSVLGSWRQSVAQAWLVYRLTGSLLQLGLVVFVGQAPLLFLSPIGGLIADRYPRRWVVVGTQTSSMLLAFVLAALTLVGHVGALVCSSNLPASSAGKTTDLGQFRASGNS